MHQQHSKRVVSSIVDNLGLGLCMIFRPIISIHEDDVIISKHSNELLRSAVIYGVEAYELAGCVQDEYQPKIPIQEHHHTATVPMGLLASKED